MIQEAQEEDPARRLETTVAQLRERLEATHRARETALPLARENHPVRVAGDSGRAP